MLYVCSAGSQLHHSYVSLRLEFPVCSLIIPLTRVDFGDAFGLIVAVHDVGRAMHARQADDLRLPFTHSWTKETTLGRQN